MTDIHFGDLVVTQRKTLFISAGHSMSDPGASGNGLTEADVVLALRDKLADALRARGVAFNRDGHHGQNLPLTKACTLARAHDVAVEFHANAARSPSATGVETLSGPDDTALGSLLCDAVADTLGIANRGAKGEGDGQHSRLAFVQAGGLILETFFITNPHDVQAYNTHMGELVERIADVLVAEVTAS